MNDTSKILSIIAYYLSAYDMEAVKSLGYSSRNDAFKKISGIFNRDNNYLKLRRDEFDVLTDSHRNGWRNRKPAKDVISMNDYLRTFAFGEITEIVLSFIENFCSSFQPQTDLSSRIPKHTITSEYTEEDIEQIINFEDAHAEFVVSTGTLMRRVYKKKIILELKRLYKYKCQICGHDFFDIYDAHLAEAHHIKFFSITHNNNASNIIILCPDHHRIIHMLNPKFELETLTWKYKNGFREQLLTNFHL